MALSCADQLPESFKFLPEIDHLQQGIPGNHDFVVTLDCDNTEVDRLKYHLEDNKIHIIITPKNGRFFEKNVTCQEQNDAFDLIITVDVADISQLGKLYEENVNLFTTVPVINIDHHVSNPGFGKLNLINVAASSTAEILYDLIRQMESHFGKTLILPETATFLLSGVTTDTGSFQNANTTPKAMEIAAQLMDAGANQQDIIKYLFRTKKLPTLKLWGRVLSKIEVDAEHRLVWSSVSQQDLKQTATQMEDVGEIMDELLVHAPEAEIVVLFKEEPDLVSVSFRSKTPAANVMEAAKTFGGGGHVLAAGAKIPGKSLAQVTNMVLAELQRVQAERLGLKTKIQAQPEQKITQILEGYTPVPEEKAVKPTLEQRVSETYQLPKTESRPSSLDLHDKTKAAIQAEQQFPADTAFKPSQPTPHQTRPKPMPEKRFKEQQIPDFLKQKSTSPEPEMRAKEDGITVKFDQPAPKPVEIPPTSVEPTVKSVPVAPVNVPNPVTPALSTPPMPTPPVPKPKPVPPPPVEPLAKPPQDPFAKGGDGLTDIERALGGL